METPFSVPRDVRNKRGGDAGCARLLAFQLKVACKPSSVSGWPMVYAARTRSFFPLNNQAAAIYLALALPPGSCGQPGDGPGPLCPLLGLAPDGVCLASDVTTRAVSSCLAFSPLLRTLPRLVGAGGAVCLCGTFRRVTPPRR